MGPTRPRKRNRWAVVLAALSTVWLGGHAGPLQAQELAPTTAPAPAVASLASKDAHKDSLVNINTASVAELQMLPGVGARKAAGIVTRREKKKFTRPEELLEVKGIGRGIFKRCKPYVRVQGPTTLAQKVVVPSGPKRG